MDFRTCTWQNAIHVLDSAVFANNSEMSSSTSRTRTSKLVFTMKDVCHTLPGQINICKYYFNSRWTTALNNWVFMCLQIFKESVCIYTKGPFPTLWFESWNITIQHTTSDAWHLLPNVIQRGPPPARQRTAIWMAFRWRADGSPTLCAGWDVCHAVLRMQICAGSSEPLSHVISNKCPSTF